MVFFGLSQAKQIQRSENKTNTTQTSNKKKGQTRRRTTRTQKKAGNKHRIRTQLAAANLPPKRALEGNPVAAFSAKFLWETVNRRSSKNRRRPKRLLKKTEVQRGPKCIIRFSLQNKWFREMAKNPPNRRGTDPKSVQKHVQYLVADFRPRDPKNAKYATF